MKSKHWATLALGSALLSGCAQTPTNGNYCDLAKPLQFSSQQTIDTLMAQDRGLLVGIVVNNETWDQFCK